MSVVTLTSGGLDSTLVACLADEAGMKQYPLFIDYGQRARDRELAACRRALDRLGLPPPTVADLSGFGRLIRSGLTDRTLRIVEDAFTPGRNMLFLLTASAYAYQVGADAVSIALLNEDTSLFPDQTKSFLREAESMIGLCMGRPIHVLAPLADFHKIDVVMLAKAKGIDETYSCHIGDDVPCGQCIACKEFDFEEA
jgi:7-cyano-7-deazaguanine synthase